MPSEREKYGRDVLAAGAATVVKSLSHLLLLPVATFNLSQPEFGAWIIILTAVNLAIPVLSLQLPAALIRFLAGVDGRGSRREGFYSTFFFLAFFAACACLATFFAAPLLARFLPLERFLPFAGPALALAGVSVLLNVGLAYLRAFRRMLAHSTLSIAQYSIELVAVYLAFTAGAAGDPAPALARSALDTLAAPLGLGASTGLGTALAYMVVIRTLLTLAALLLVGAGIGLARPRFSTVPAYLKYSLPLVPNSTFYYLFDASDRFVIGRLISNAAVGVYSAAYTTAGVIGTLFAPLHFVLFPLLARLWHQRRSEEIAATMTESLRYSALLAFPAWCGLAVLAGPLFDYLAPPEYRAGALPLIAPLAAGFGLFGFAVIAGNLVASAGQTRYLLRLDATLAVGNIALNLLLVPIWGLAGAVTATLAGHLYYAGAVLLRARRLVSYAVPWKSLLHYALAAGLMGGGLHGSGASAWPLPVSVAAGAALYFGLLAASGGLGGREWRYIKRLIGSGG